MNKIIVLVLLACSFFSMNAQSSQRAGYVADLVNKSPYQEVRNFLGNPDTIMICKYPLRRVCLKDMPSQIVLFLYKKDDVWWAAHMVKYSNRGKAYWKLFEAVWVETELSNKIEDAIVELMVIDRTEDISTIHTWIYIKFGNTITQDLIGNYRDFAEYAPVFSYVFLVGLLESYNPKCIKTYPTK